MRGVEGKEKGGDEFKFEIVKTYKGKIGIGLGSNPSKVKDSQQLV
jgi:hypothetical protein